MQTTYTKQRNALYSRAMRDNRTSRKVLAKRNNQTALGVAMIALCAIGIIGAIAGAVYFDTKCKPSISTICKR